MSREVMRGHNIRVDDPTWDAAVARAEQDGIALSEAIRFWLQQYGSGADTREYTRFGVTEPQKGKTK